MTLEKRRSVDERGEANVIGGNLYSVVLRYGDRELWARCSCPYFSDRFTHPLPDSTIFLDVQREQVVAELRLPAAQFEIGFGRPVPRTSAALSAALRREIARYVADHLTAAPSGRQGVVHRGA